MKIHILMKSEGEYSDRSVKAEKAFKSLSAAKKYLKSEEARVRLWQAEKNYNTLEINYWIESVELVEREIK